MRRSVSRNETPAKIVFRFCCFITDVFQLWPYTEVTNDEMNFTGTSAARQPALKQGYPWLKHREVTQV
jgi:hypothetical protein